MLDPVQPLEYESGLLREIPLACVVGVIGEGEGEQGRREKMREPSFFLASLAPLPLPRLRRPRRLQSLVSGAKFTKHVKVCKSGRLIVTS